VGHCHSERPLGRRRILLARTCTKIGIQAPTPLSPNSNSARSTAGDHNIPALRRRWWLNFLWVPKIDPGVIRMFLSSAARNTLSLSTSFGNSHHK